MSKSSCGAHTELTSNNAVRVTRCACGIFHVTIHASGVTVRLNGEAFRGVAAGLASAAERYDDRAEVRAIGTSTIN